MGHSESVQASQFIGSHFMWIVKWMSSFPCKFHFELESEWSGKKSMRAKLLKLKTLYSQNGMHFMRTKTARKIPENVKSRSYICVLCRNTLKNDNVPLNHLAYNCDVVVDFCVSPFLPIFSEIPSQNLSTKFTNTHTAAHGLIEYGVHTLDEVIGI